MANASLKITSKTNADEKITTTVQYINPKLKPTEMKEFSQKLNALTNNIYESTTLIETTDVDTEPAKIDLNDLAGFKTYTKIGSATQVEYTEPVTVHVSELPSDRKIGWGIQFESSSQSYGRINPSLMMSTVTSTDGTPSKGTTNVYYNGNQWSSATLTSAAVQDVTIHAALIENDTFYAWEKDFVIHVIEDE